tara:strand:+ start:5567 stop:6997 length:1431 start_codon:yes stop_codon:yes gene_type:complete
MSINLNFDNSYLNLPDIFYSIVRPDNFPKTKIVLFNEKLANDLNLNYLNTNQEDLGLILTAQKLDNYTFFSQAYAGHQFGHFTILGDGRALFLGEHLNNKNERFDLQLKGSGKTPYSRNGDGKAALGPMMREYLISEAMHYLNIKTTRSLAVTLTGEKIFRENMEQGAVLTRVAKSHIRIGTFEFANLIKNKSNIEELINYTIKRHYPELIDNNNKIESFLTKVLLQQVKMIVGWMRVGFIHGVMNTDNMSIIGETIDYGPCAFMDEYNPSTVFSSIDTKGRYSYQNQPIIANWNLARLAETLLFLIDKDEKKAISKATKIINKFKIEYQKNWLIMMKSKLGLNEENKKDKQLIVELLNIMHVFKLDFNNTFIKLENKEIYKYDYLKEWLNKYEERKKLEKNNKQINLLMKTNNPKIIPRNHIIDKLLKEAEKNNYKNINTYLKLLKNPYNNENIPEIYTKPPSEEEKISFTYCGT